MSSPTSMDNYEICHFVKLSNLCHVMQSKKQIQLWKYICCKYTNIQKIHNTKDI